MTSNRLPTSHQHTGLRLVTLGDAALIGHGAGCDAAPLLRTGKPLALLVYLACAPRRTATREHLIDLLWADLDPEHAPVALRQAVFQIRRTVGVGVLLGSEGALTLADSVVSDRAAFLGAVDAGALDDAVVQYSGDFLPNSAIPGGVEFEQWVAAERYRLRLAFVSAAEIVVRHQLSGARFREAQQLAKRVRDADRARESGWRLLIETHLSAGDALGTRLEADSLEMQLVAEERVPEPATRALLAMAKQAPAEGAPGSRSRGLVAELVGRHVEFSRIVTAWNDARRGSGRHVHLKAAAGLGKTRLLNDLAARLRASGARTIYLRANPGSRNIAYAFASELAGSLATLPGAAGVSPDAVRTLVALNPSLSAPFSARPDTSTDDEALRRRGIALAELVDTVAADSPIAMLLDDMHWADPVSRQIVTSLAAKVSAVHTLLVTAARPVADGAVEVQNTDTVTLPPLTVDHVGSLIASLGALPDATWAESLPASVHAATNGSPLLVLETVQLAIEHETLALDESGWSCRDPAALENELAVGGALRHRIEQLDRRQRWVLLLLAVAGTPLSVVPCARAAGYSPEALAENLDALEQRGMVGRLGGEWEAAHDEIAALTIELAEPVALKAAHVAIGRVLATAADGDTHVLHRAGRHLAAGGAETELPDVYRRWVLVSRRRGDRRSFRLLASDLLGDARTARLERSLPLSLPALVRVGLTTSRRVVAVLVGVVTVVGTAAGVVLAPAPLPPDAILLAIREQPGRLPEVREIPIRRDMWNDREQLDLARHGRAYRGVVFSEIMEDADASPDGSRWAFRRTMPDPFSHEIFVTANDSLHRLTVATGDDIFPRWSPDGRFLVFATTRWNAYAWADLAALNLTTGRVRQLTAGNDTDSPGQWSPDGSRIAFSRIFNRGTIGESGESVCWVTFDGGTERCLGVLGVWTKVVLAWRDNENVLVHARNIELQKGFVILLNVDTEEIDTLDTGLVEEARVSRDGGWVASLRRPRGAEHAQWYVYPTGEEPNLGRRVELGGDSTGHTTLQWLPARQAPTHIHRIAIHAPSDTLPVHAAYQLQASPRNAAGDLVPWALRRWSSNDMTVATVDAATGLVHPVRPGEVTLTVSAGGWRRRSVKVVFGNAKATPVLFESWLESWAAEWTPYGAPTPTRIVGPGGTPSFANNGDGRFQSGAYSRRVFDASRGLGVEARLSTPVNAVQYQTIVFALTTKFDSALLKSWDHIEGSPPTVTGPSCNAVYPHGDGPPELRPLFAAGERVRPTARMRSGDWWRLRVQILPDGRCGVAIDGRPVAIDQTMLQLNGPFRLVVEGSSVGTRMLVGPLEIWEGVRGDVDWRVMDRRQRP